MQNLFGFLNPKSSDLRYRSLYSRGCQQLKLNHGIRSLLFHSFESVFLYSFAADVGAFDRKHIPQRSCCKLQASRTLISQPDWCYGQFGANLSMLLTSIKLEDDILDNQSMLAKIARSQLKLPIKNAERYFSSIDANFKTTTGQIIQEHHRLENSSKSISVEQLCQPTATGFAYMFQLYSHLPKLERFNKPLARIGQHLGSAIISFDCAADWQKDLKRGDYNPITSAKEAQESFAKAAQELRAAARYVEPITDEDSTSPEILDQVADRIENEHLEQNQQEPFQPKQSGCGHNILESGAETCSCCATNSGECCLSSCFELTCGTCAECC